MRLLIEFGYQKVLFPKGCDYSGVIEAVGTAQMVEEKGPFGARVLIPMDGGEVGVKLIPDGDISLPDIDRGAEVEKLLQIAQEKNDLQMKVYTLEAELKKIRDAAAPQKSVSHERRHANRPEQVRRHGS